MRTMRMAFLGLVLFCGNAYAETADEPAWRYEFTLYGWVPDVDGTLRYDLPSSGGGVGVDSGSILQNLDMALMGALEARRERWSLFADLVYLKLSDTNDGTLMFNPGPGPGLPLEASVEQKLKGWLASMLLGYNLFDNGRTRFDLAGGLRYLSVDADATVALNGPLPPTPPPRTLSGSARLWDGIVAVRGRYDFNDRWSLPYHLDIGTGDSNLTWQAAIGIVRHLSWGDLKLFYRHLSYDQGKDKLLQDVSFSGPLLGIGFRF